MIYRLIAFFKAAASVFTDARALQVKMAREHGRVSE
jgi:hypothetical protein